VPEPHQPVIVAAAVVVVACNVTAAAHTAYPPVVIVVVVAVDVVEGPILSVVWKGNGTWLVDTGIIAASPSLCSVVEFLMYATREHIIGICALLLFFLSFFPYANPRPLLGFCPFVLSYVTSNNINFGIVGIVINEMKVQKWTAFNCQRN
jgi:hypothetical protein